MGEPENGLSLPVRRLIACGGIVVFLCLYVMLVTTVAEYLPKNKLVEMLYYGLSGTLWGIPVIPIISWSENYKKKARK